jgi:hypothetical protein
MQSNQVDSAGNGRLRVVFGGTVMSFSLTADATFEDVARKLDRISIRRYGRPVAIDVTLCPSNAALPD